LLSELSFIVADLGTMAQDEMSLYFTTRGTSATGSGPFATVARLAK
jgi:hypothetical protein